MAHREVTMVEVKEILRLWLMGVPKKRLAHQLGFDVKTARRYLSAAKAQGVEHGLAALDDELVAAVVAATQPGTGRPRSEGWAVCEAHREFVAKHLENGMRRGARRPLRLLPRATIERTAFAVSSDDNPDVLLPGVGHRGRLPPSPRRRASLPVAGRSSALGAGAPRCCWPPDRVVRVAWERDMRSGGGRASTPPPWNSRTDEDGQGGEQT